MTYIPAQSLTGLSVSSATRKLTCYFNAALAVDSNRPPTRIQEANSMRLDHLRRAYLRRGRRVQAAVVRDLFEMDVGMEKERLAHVA